MHTGERLHGTVVAAYGRRYRVEADTGQVFDCLTRGKRSEVACGDRVLVTATAPDQGVIEATDPRSALLYRADAYRQKLIAANVTQVVVVVAPRPSFHDGLVSRCLAAAEYAHLGALIVLNKADLGIDTARATLAPFEAAGYPVVVISAHRSVAELEPHLAGQHSVLVGQSGMGKSTLVNALVPGTAAATREFSEALGTGKHTTTHARLYQLREGATLIDSPGLQAFGLGHVPAADADHTFREFRPYLGTCRFANCRHLAEPGCAISAACAAGSIDRRRLAAYREIALELEHVARAVPR